MNVLRRISTRHLLALCAAVVALGAGGTALATALSGSGPVPPRKPLARAVHDALAAPAVDGVTARISFTNHLIDSSSVLQGADPLLTGATGRLWIGAHQLRLELQSSRGSDSQLLISGGKAWFYDGSSDTVYRASLGNGADKPATKSGAKHASGVPTVAEIQKTISKLSAHLSISGARPGDIARHAAYTVRVSPRHDGGLLAAVEGAWDAVHGIPLRIGVYATGDSSPVLELKATHLSTGRVPLSAFRISYPHSAKVVDLSSQTSAKTARHTGRSRAHSRHAAEPTGIAAVQAKLRFKLAAPATLVGLPRKGVSLVSMGHSPAALVTYGQGLGGIAVLEHPTGAKGAAKPARAAQAPSADGGHGASLPTVSIAGSTGHELATALGTLITFDRAGVSYIVVGSVPANAAEAAARGL